MTRAELELQEALQVLGAVEIDKETARRIQDAMYIVDLAKKYQEKGFSPSPDGQERINRAEQTLEDVFNSSQGESIVERLRREN